MNIFGARTYQGRSGLARKATRALALLALLFAALPFSLRAQIGGMGGMGGMGGFGGPSVMGRGGQAGQRGGQAVRLRGFGAVNGVYDSGLTTLTQDGVIRPQGAGGVETLWGAYGVHSGKRSAVGLDYQGDYRYYGGGPGSALRQWNGFSQTLSLTYSARPFRRASFDLSGMAGTTNRAFGAVAGNFDPSGNGLAQSVVPVNSLFDVRTNYLNATGSLTLIHSSRLSTSYSGSGFVVRRRSRLPGVEGVIGRADVAYRLGKRQTIGADILYYKFDYTNAFGDVNIIDPGIIFGQQFGRRWEASLRIGVMRVESFGTRQVNLEPEIAALLGVGSTSEIFYLRTFQPSGQLRLTRNFKRGSVIGAYRIIPNPGNGLLFASRMNQADLTASWVASRRVSFNLGANSSRMASVTSLAGSFNQYQFGGGMSYKFNRSMELMARVDRRVAELNTGTGISLNGNRLTVGLAFSPSDVPLQLW